MFDLNASQVFVCVVEEQGFTAAAHRLGMPKQTVSRKVSKLEETLGVRLLERSTRKLRMTSAGEVFFGSHNRLYTQPKWLKKASYKPNWNRREHYILPPLTCS